MGANSAGIEPESDLSQRAFHGRMVWLMECAMALEFPEPAIIPKCKRPSIYVYFIGAETGPIKIGTARDPYGRLMMLQTGHPEELYLYAMTAGGLVEERQYHSEFAIDRLRGEWFKRTDRILRRIVVLQEAEATRLTPRAGGAI